VPGTSGAPGGYTPSPTPGGVATGGGTGTASTPWGNLAGMLGIGGGGPAPAAAGPNSAQRAAMMLAGWRMLQPTTPMSRGGTPATLSTAGQNPLVAQIQQMLGVDRSTAEMMALMYHPGGTAMNPSQQSQFTLGSNAFMPSSQPAPPSSPLLPSSAMPTPQNPYAVPRDPGTLSAPLPRLGSGAFAPATPQPQMLYGSFA